MNTHHVLRVDGLSYRVGDRQLFDNLNLTLGSGRSVAVLGPSGSGKSSLLSLALGLIKPQSGTIEIDGRDITALGRRELALLRAESVGMVFQFAELLSELSPAENVALAALLAGRSGPELDAEVARLLDELGVPRSASVSTLSGGERQRAAVARALINRPRLLLADEPTGSLDDKNRDLVADMLFELPQRHGCGLLVVTHDGAVAERADHVLTVSGRDLVPLAGSGATR
ncbi:ABC transporter ATP-binding protein [Lentzea albidocapillata]|uniref:Lipoprotein-releasing system ATP-binding protein n=1 Tax=Lentzea albidocapillata TaxID=40571 RepID=A0A1W2FDI7_9PSEU|nr:ATP-binding cassette domain-containing protein [Lentzea albidocapillata]SMD19957.1 lipoprotein-releasing system ATP-binding protein [Lentzea albidocapillata]